MKSCARILCNGLRKEFMKEQILRLKKEKNAVILAHYYAPAEAQEIADFVGDSFYLAKVAKSSDADVIVFCGVSFMGESAKILNPEKKVLMPDTSADCPMAHMVKDGAIAEMREKYGDLAVVCYINSSAEIKSCCDVCVTSSNALKIVRNLPNKNIYFIPDKNLGRFVKEQVPEKNIILGDGYCPIHAAITSEQILALKRIHPSATVMGHPECGAEVTALCDVLGSTAELISYAEKSDSSEFIVCTEAGVDFELKKRGKGKKFYYPEPIPCCVDMKLNNLENILTVLRDGCKEVILDAEKIEAAKRPLDEMLRLAR